MQLLGKPLLEDFKKRHSSARKLLNAWRIEVEKSKWESPQDVKSRYVTASIFADNRVIFNIKGNNYRLVVKIRYYNSIVHIEWIGTHEEYNKKKF